MSETEPRKSGGKTGKPQPPVEHQFKAGNPGRPKGSRNKLGEAFIAALHDDFIEHGAETIAKVRDTDPTAYVKVCASLLPKELKIETHGDLNDDELDRRIRQLAATISLEIGASGSDGGEAEANAAPEASSVSAVH